MKKNVADWVQVLINREISDSKAYRSFLKEQKYDLSRKEHVLDALPKTNKDNFLRKFPLTDLIDIKKQNFIFASTSGTTGEPYYFPRGSKQIIDYAEVAREYLVENFHVDKVKTLYINCFALGVWIGGLFTHEAILYLQDQDDLKIDLVSPGISTNDALNAIQNLQKFYNQIIIAGYPPFIKDLLDDAEGRKIKFKKNSIGIIFSAEGFSEEFRNHVINKAGGSIKKIETTLNHYGTVDLGTMAYETPLAIHIRKMCIKNKLLDSFFHSQSKLPTLAQFDPTKFHFVEEEGMLLCTSDSGIPLINYELKDLGGVISYNLMMKRLAENRISVPEKFIKRKWPFVFVYERADLSVTLYGLNIYPEIIKRSLMKFVDNGQLTGRFVISVQYKKNFDQYLQIDIEGAKNINKSDLSGKSIQASTIEQMTNDISEYSKLISSIGRKGYPKIVLHSFQGHAHFNRKGKQSWVAK